MKSGVLKLALVIIYIIISFSSSAQNDKLSNQQIVSVEGDTIPLSKIIDNKVLVFRYSIMNCRPCIDSTLMYIKEYEDIIGDENILLLTYYSEFRHFIISARLNQIKYRVFLLPDNKFAVKEDDLGLPYVFIIDKDLEVSNPFIVYNIYEQRNQLKAYFLAF